MKPNTLLRATGRHTAAGLWCGAVASLAATALAAQTPDSTRRDSLRVDTLPPLSIFADAIYLPADDRPFSVSRRDMADALQARPSLGLDEVLQTVPGVYAANRYNFSLDQRVSIRGFGARSAFGVRGVMVLLDGIPQTLPDGQGQLTNVELSDVSDIEVLRGPGSTLYGNGAGGIISLRTRLDPAEDVDPRAQVVTGSSGLLKLYGGARAPLGRGVLAGSVSHTRVDGFRQHSRAELWHGSVRAVQPLGRSSRLTLLGEMDRDPTLQNPGALTAAEADTLPSMADPRNVAADAGKSLTQGQLGAALRHDFVSGGTAQMAVFGLRRTLDNPLAFALIGLRRWAAGARASLRWPLRGALPLRDVTVGVDASWQRDERENRTPDRTTVVLDETDRVRSVGPFMYARGALGPALPVVAGVRWDAVRFAVDDRLGSDGDQSGARSVGALSWMAGLTWRWRAALSPFVNAGTSFETPTTTEFINRADGGAGLNPDLDPQHALQVELGVRGRLPGVGHYTAAAFRARVRDELIPFESPVEPGRVVYRNAGASVHRGFELSLDGALAWGLGWRAAYTWADYRFTDFVVDADTLSGNRLPGVPTHRLYASLHYRTAGGFYVMADNTYTSALFADDANVVSVDRWLLSSYRVGQTLDVGAWRLDVFQAVDNIFNRRYVSSVVVNARGGRYFEPGPQRTLVVGMTVRRSAAVP